MNNMQSKRTENLIFSSFDDLLIHRPFHKITIQNIVDKAMIHRNTFYSHFIDKYDLLKRFCWNYLFNKINSKFVEEFNRRPFYVIHLLYWNYYQNIYLAQKNSPKFIDLISREFSECIIQNSDDEKSVWSVGKVVSIMVWNNYHHYYYDVVRDYDKLDKIFNDGHLPRLNKK